MIKRLRRTAISQLSVFIVLLTVGAYSYGKLETSEQTLPLSFTQSQSTTAQEIVIKLQSRHYLSHRFNDRISSRLLDNYLQRLDSSRALFLQADLEEFEAYRYTLDDSLNKGDLNPGFVIFNRYQARISDRFESVIAELPNTVKQMDFTLDESIQIDRSKEAWPKNQAEADELWRKIVKSRILSLKLAGKSNDEIVTLLTKRYSNQLHRVRQSRSEDAFQIYMNALTELYDPHTNYLSPASSENFNINMSLKLEGIGAVLQSENEYTKVIRLVHAGPADKQGQLQPSDRIVAVAQDKDGEFQDVVGMRLDEVVKLIRGPKDSIVRLKVIPVSAKTDDEQKTIKIVRNTVKLEEQSAQKEIIEILDNDRLIKVGVIDIPAFYIDFEAMRRGDVNYKSTTRDVQKLLTELVDDGVEGIIIDLRENGGGSLQEANALTGLFIDSGPTVQIRHSSTKIYREGKRRSSEFYDGPLVVLINRLSASASEIFAGAIQDYQRGLIVGTQSFGKGTVQSLTPLQQGQIKITESKFYRISGDSTQHRGVIPDITFPTLYDTEKVGESSLHNALPWDRIDPIRHHRYFDFPKILPQLNNDHQQRMAGDPDFIFLNDQIALMEEARNIEFINLNENLRSKERADNKSKSLAIENKRRIAKGLEPLESIPDEDDDELAATAADEEDDSEDEEVDPLLFETGRILVDSIPVYFQDRFAVRQ